MERKILEIIENALVFAGYEILDDDDEYIVIRHSASDTDYKITVEEEPC